MPGLGRKALLAAVALLASTSVSIAADIEGSIAWDFKCKDLDALRPQTKVVLDGGRYKASIRKDGKFTLYDVAPGSYLLEVLARDHDFDPIRVEVLPPSTTPLPDPPVALSEESSSDAPFDPNSEDEPPLEKSPSSSSTPAHPQPTILIRPSPPGTPFHPSSSASLPLLAYPIILTTRGQKIYDVPVQGFDLFGMLWGNPMMIMMVVAGGLIFVMPKIMENLDPDLVKEMGERQGKMYSLQSSIQSGDFGALKKELLDRADSLDKTLPAVSKSAGAASNSSSASTSNRLPPSTPGASGSGGSGSGTPSKKSGGRKKR